jgi:hypothetical protein
VLKTQYNRDRNPSAAKTLADYYATSGRIDEAKRCPHESISKFEGAGAKGEAYIHSLIALACCETGIERSRVFALMDNQVPNWQVSAHPIYSAMVAQARNHPGIEWRDILSGIANPRGA